MGYSEDGVRGKNKNQACGDNEAGKWLASVDFVASRTKGNRVRKPLQEEVWGFVDDEYTKAS